MEQFNYITVLSRFDFYEVYFKKFSLFYDDDESHTLDITTCDSFDWGRPSPLVVQSPETYPLPTRLELRWVTANEGKCFEISTSLDQERTEALWKKQALEFPKDPFRQYLIGVGPYGGVAVWLCSNEKSVLLHWLIAEETTMTEQELKMHTPEPEMEEFVDTLLPFHKLQCNMRQYPYRMVPLEEFIDGKQWQRFDHTDPYYETIEVDGVEVKRLDATFDYSDNNDLMRYHKFGKPCRITVKWHEDEAGCLAHFWLDEAVVTSVFEGFFKKFPDAKADLLLRIDTRNNRYEIAMTGENLPVRTLWYTQYIVFRDYVEIARSEDYTKEDGAWIWE